MKKLILLTTSILLVAAVAFAATLAFDAFNYADGSLVGNGGWISGGGTAGDFLVEGNQAVVQHGVPSEDVNLPFVAASASSKLYYRLDFSVDDVGQPLNGADNEYFAHFKDSGFGFRARIYIVAPNAGGDFTVGLSTTSGGSTVSWPTDLTYGETYTAIVLFDQTANIAQLWLDPADESSPSILGVDLDDPGDAMVAFALRQSDSSDNETVRVDNVEVSETLNPVATEDQTWGSVKSMFR